jgi:hypothetical protein
VPIVGFTWYSLTDQVDWDVALRQNNQTVNPLGLYDLDRNIRPVGKAYKQLIKDWRQVLPTQSSCLIVPIALPNEFNENKESKASNKQAERDKKNDTPTPTLLKAGKTKT